MALKMMDGNNNRTDNAKDIAENAINNAFSEKNETDKLVVGYFGYKNMSEADKARAEQERIVKLENQINYDNPKMVYTLYNKILAGDYFHTPEGLLYLVHLQDYLYSKESQIPGPIAPIPSDYTRDKSKKSNEQLEEERVKLLDKVRSLESDKSKAYKNIKIKQKKTDNIVYKIIIAGMAIIIVGMLVIAGASSSPNIINYRNQIQDEYSDWEKQLLEREKELREREKSLEKVVSDEGETRFMELEH